MSPMTRIPALQNLLRERGHAIGIFIIATDIFDLSELTRK